MVFLWYLLTGIGSGLSANILLKNICFFYPKKKGLVSSLLMSFIAISMAVFTLLGEQIVNPNKEPIIDEINDPYYSYEVSQNVKKYFIFTLIAFPAFNLFAIIFFYKYDPKCEKEEGGEEQIETDENFEKKEETKETLMNKNNNQPVNTFYKKASKTKVQKVIKGFRFWRNIIIVGLLPFYFSILNASFRAYIAMLGLDQSIIYFLGCAIGLIICFVGPIWATLVDKFGFQPIMKIIGFIISGMSIYFVFFIDSPYGYLIGFIIAIVAFVGIMSATTPHLMNVFGMSNFLLIMGFALLFNQISSFSAALISIIISIFYKNAFELKVPYQIVCLEGGVLSFIGLVMVFYENDEKFVYGDENEENKYFIKNGDNNTVEKENDKDKNYYNENAGTILAPSNNTTIDANNN